nr:GAF domain-containing protein [Taibaiella sp. KBW10]
MAQAEALLAQETNTIANMANICAILKEQFNWFWIGFYSVDQTNNTLVLGPFQGPIACTRIPHGKGVCGTAWAKAETIIVKDVHQFEGHIACSSLSQSEIVVPLKKDDTVWAVLDIDSETLATFDLIDQEYLERIVGLL